MKIKCLENFSIEGVMHHEGELRVVDDEVGKTAVENGWAEDADGKIPTGERSIHPKTLNVKGMKHVHGTTKAEG